MDLSYPTDLGKSWGSLWNSKRSWILTDRATTRLFPGRFFQLFSQFVFFSSQIHLFLVIPSVFGRPNRCYSGTLRVFFLAIPDFYLEKNLGRTLGFSSGHNEFGIFKLPEHSRTSQNNPGSDGNSHPHLLRGVRGCWECFPCGNGGGKGIPFTAGVGIVSLCVPGQ